MRNDRRLPRLAGTRPVRSAQRARGSPPPGGTALARVGKRKEQKHSASFSSSRVFDQRTAVLLFLPLVFTLIYVTWCHIQLHQVSAHNTSRKSSMWTWKLNSPWPTPPWPTRPPEHERPRPRERGGVGASAPLACEAAGASDEFGAEEGMKQFVSVSVFFHQQRQKT